MKTPKDNITTALEPNQINKEVNAQCSGGNIQAGEEATL